MSRARIVLTALAATFAANGEALAHASERGFVLLLPTHYYVAGGALAVALSFLILAFLPADRLARLAACRLPLINLHRERRALVSLVSFAVLTFLLFAGFAGSRDPLSNPLPLVVWTLFWVGLTLAQGVFGNLWAWLNPWYGPWRLAVAIGLGRRRLALPAWLAHWPAVAIFLAFAWFELVDPAPDDPQRLAVAVSAYWLFTFAGMLLFGFRAWSRRVECFSIFYAIIARLSLFERARTGRKGVKRLSLRLPGAKLVEAAALPPSAVALLLLVLSSVSFDGFMRTFFWLGAIGVNPLEFPGRSAVVAANSLGLLAMFLLLAGIFTLAVFAGDRLAGGRSLAPAAGLLVWSIAPISLAYHFAHYLVSFLLNGQYALAALSDPLSRGWNLFGTAGLHVQAGVTLGPRSAWMIWNAQAAAIIGGHVLAVVIAHLLAHRIYGDARRAILSQIPLVLLMIFYTVFGLWLLSAPTAG